VNRRAAAHHLAARQMQQLLNRSIVWKRRMESLYFILIDLTVVVVEKFESHTLQTSSILDLKQLWLSLQHHFLQR
jgi:hypothetical protein